MEEGDNHIGCALSQDTLHLIDLENKSFRMQLESKFV